MTIKFEVGDNFKLFRRLIFLNRILRYLPTYLATFFGVGPDCSETNDIMFGV